jgi:L,D-transpeptidase YcbB
MRPTPALISTRRLHIMLILLAIASVSVNAPAFSASPAPEQLQLRVGALAQDPRVAGQLVADPWFLSRFYERGGYRPAWDSGKLDQLRAAVAGSVRHGLNPEDYHAGTLAELVDALESASRVGLVTELDILATDALARLAFHLRFGKVNPMQIEPTWNLSRDMGNVSPVTALRGLLQADDLVEALDGFAPATGYYRVLQKFLGEYREIGAGGGWPRVDAGEILRLDIRSDRVPALRARLAASGDLPAEAVPVDDPERFDEALDLALKGFQARHGLQDDGVLGRATLATINVPVEARIDQLRTNLERARWVFRDLDERFLVVNIARYQVLLIENHRVTWSTRAVVGRPYRQTPAFKARMTYLEFNPTWTVPPTIFAKDLLPEIRVDPTTLQRKNMTVIDSQGRRVDPAGIDWATIPARGFPYMIRQEPGPTNALGRVKFMFPNPHHVYMHDTPARELFGRTERTFSSGCIRLEHPLELARILLAGTEWDDEAIERVLASGRTRVVNLPRPITALMLYGTAGPDGDQVYFAADIYRRDARLLAALDAPFVFTPPGGYAEALRLDEAAPD